jgi:hypothetical protein
VADSRNVLRDGSLSANPSYIGKAGDSAAQRLHKKGIALGGLLSTGKTRVLKQEAGNGFAQKALRPKKTF